MSENLENGMPDIIEKQVWSCSLKKRTLDCELNKTFKCLEGICKAMYNSLFALFMIFKLLWRRNTWFWLSLHQLKALQDTIRYLNGTGCPCVSNWAKPTAKCYPISAASEAWRVIQLLNTSVFSNEYFKTVFSCLNISAASWAAVEDPG